VLKKGQALKQAAAIEAINSSFHLFFYFEKNPHDNPFCVREAPPRYMEILPEVHICTAGSSCEQGHNGA
jgi:hypothetical protein